MFALRVVAAWLAMWFSVLVGNAAGAVLSRWMGREAFIPAVAPAVVVLGRCGWTARRRFRWAVRDFVAAYLVAIPTALAVIWHIGGEYRLNAFYLEWLAAVCLPIGVAWFAGLACGSWPAPQVRARPRSGC